MIIMTCYNDNMTQIYNMPFRNYVAAYRQKCGLSLREFWYQLRRYAPPDDPKSYRTVNRWEINGPDGPLLAWMYWIYNHAPVDSWQREFAARGMDILTGAVTEQS